MKNIFVTYIYPIITAFGVIITISSFFLNNAGNNIYTIIALAMLCIFLSSILFAILLALRNFIISHFKDDYRRVSSFYVYEEDQKGVSTFEMYRLIQCKRILLTGVPYKYKWTGGSTPKITSNHQKIKKEKVGKKDEWDEVTLKFAKPLTFNESTVLHVKTDNKDLNNKAKPWIECKLETPIEFMHFRILLSYKEKDYSDPAIFERKRINANMNNEFETIDRISFNKTYMQYSYSCMNPEPGYYYRLRWEK